MASLHKDAIHRAMRTAWSNASSSQWTQEQPAAGQCSPTCLVIQDFFGGSLLKTRCGDTWHYYNVIGGNIFDFTAEQFRDEPEYLDIAATREEALSDCTEAQYRALYQRFLEIWTEHH